MIINDEIRFYSGVPHWAGKGYVLDKDNIHIMMRYEQTDMSFRDACFMTAEKIRERTDKRIVIPVSGGADSALISYIFDKAGIETTKIHQKYKFRNRTLNQTESSQLTHTRIIPNIYQNVDVVKFVKSDFYQDLFIKQFPLMSYAATQAEIINHPDIDRERDYIIWGTGIPLMGRFTPHSPLQCYEQSIRRFRRIATLQNGFEDTEFFEDNPIILSAIYCPFFKRQMNMWNEHTTLYDIEWRNYCKKDYYSHYFPEIGDWFMDKKSHQRDWYWFSREDISHRTNHYINMKTGETYFSSPNRTINTWYLDDVYDVLKNDRPVKTINNMVGHIHSIKPWATENDDSKDGNV